MVLLPQLLLLLAEGKVVNTEGRISYLIATSYDFFCRQSAITDTRVQRSYSHLKCRIRHRSTTAINSQKFLLKFLIAFLCARIPVDVFDSAVIKGYSLRTK